MSTEQNPTPVRELVVPARRRAALSALVDSLLAEYGRPDDPRFLREVRGLGHLLPHELGEALRDLRYAESTSTLVVRGGPELGDPGPTPPHWQARDSAATLRYDMWLMLVAGQFGDPVAWSVWQDGRLINDILPVRGDEAEQTGLGSEAELEFHVEEALYEHRCDLLALMCLRNDDAIPTTVASVDSLDLAALDVDVLCQPRFQIGGPDGRICPALFGSPDSPYLRVDPPYMKALPGDERAASAFAQLCRGLREGLTDVVLERGDVLLVDNYRAVHGRRPFLARHDGTDRWLHRCTTSRDLRPTRGQRRGPDGRVITPIG